MSLDESRIDLHGTAQGLQMVGGQAMDNKEAVEARVLPAVDLGA
jgi:hypothetical protein